MSDKRPPLRLVLLWHFHQPEYTDPTTGAACMPWTRLHALKDYADMVEHLARHPGVRATINVVPTLLDQLEALAGGKAPPDPFLAVARRDADALSSDERRFVVVRFFSYHRQTMAAGLPRVHELAALRGEYEQDEIPQSVVDRFDAAALRDLQVLFHLAWCGHLLGGEPLLRALRAKGRNYTEEDKQALLDLQQGFLATLPSRWRKLAESGNVEFSVSAYYHPILPLLCGLDSALEALPGLRLPSARFAHAEDAEAQLSAAREAFERMFGRRATGGWPPEGAMSETSLALMARAGYRWAAGDEDVLFASLGERIPPDRASAEIRRGTLLYRPWRHGDGPVLLFRDHELSDRIGFVYSAWHPSVAADDLIRRLTRIRDTLPPDQGPYTVSVILDGENAWEHYPDNGVPFLEALYAGLEAEPAIETRTASQATDPLDARPLHRIVAGSWIGGNLATWIGHPEKNRAWERLARARDAVAEARGAPTFGDPAWRAIFAAEGSDWFWWFGDDHPTAFAAEFDRAFRRQLGAAWSIAGLEPPEELDRPIRSGLARAITLPTGRIRPKVDGRAGDFFEWLGAGRAETSTGAMQSASRLVQRVFYGTDGERLYVRMDPVDPPASAVLGGAILSIRVPGRPERDLRAPLPAAGGAIEGDLEVAVDRVVEASVPLSMLPCDEKGIHFQLEIETTRGTSQRVPQEGSLLLPAPEEDPSLFDWSV